MNAKFSLANIVRPRLFAPLWQSRLLRYVRQDARSNVLTIKTAVPLSFGADDSSATADLSAVNAVPVGGLSPLARGPIRRRTLHEDLIVVIRELIVSGQLASGIKVPEKELCDQFGVSRTPLREALKVLATDGLVVLEANRGARVSPITRQDLDEVFPVMGALEALAGELACRNITDAEIAATRRQHDLMVEHYRAKRLDQYFAVNEVIHEAILQGARNATLTAQYRSLAVRVRRARYVANMTMARWEQATQEHEQIIQALENRDGAALSRILKEHLENKLATVRDWLDQQAAETGQGRA